MYMSNLASYTITSSYPNQNQIHELTDKQEQLLLALELIQYDMLEGKEYTSSTFFNIPN